MRRRTSTSKLSTLMMAVGAVLILAAAGLFSMYDRQEWEAEQNAELLLHQVQMQMEENQEPYEDPYDVDEKLDHFNLAYCQPMGILQVAELGLELPVLDQWNYQLLTVAPCCYSGSVEDRKSCFMIWTAAHTSMRWMGLRP